MAIIFQHKITLRLGFVFCFGTISSVADEEGILHRIVDPPEKKPSSKISGKVGTKQKIAQPPVLRAKITSCKPGAESSFTRRTPLSTSSTERWTRITSKKRSKQKKARQAALLAPPPSKEDREKLVVTATPFYTDVLFIGGRVESSPISNDEPTVPGEKPPQREARRRRNRRRNARRHHEPENETRRNLYHEMRSWRWEKLMMNESSGKERTPADVIVGKIKSKPSRRRDNTERTLSSDET
jgi:hypothetical protein